MPCNHMVSISLSSFHLTLVILFDRFTVTLWNLKRHKKHPVHFVQQSHRIHALKIEARRFMEDSAVNKFGSGAHLALDSSLPRLSGFS